MSSGKELRLFLNCGYRQHRGAADLSYDVEYGQYSKFGRQSLSLVHNVSNSWEMHSNTIYQLNHDLSFPQSDQLSYLTVFAWLCTTGC